MGQDGEESEEDLGVSTDLTAPSENGVVDATATAPQALTPCGLCLTRQVKWALMGLLPEEERESKTVTHMHI